MMARRPVVTIDGPAGAGKSTASRTLAERLGFTYLDTGALYRAVALAAGDDAALAARVDACADVAQLAGSDATRAAAPLVCPAGALIVDSSALSAEQVVAVMLDAVTMRERS